MLGDPKFTIPYNAIVKLVIRPNLQCQAVLEALKNDNTKKKAIFDLKKQLEVTIYVYILSIFPFVWLDSSNINSFPHNIT